MTNLGKVIMNEKKEKSERGCGVRSDRNYTRITTSIICSTHAWLLDVLLEQALSFDILIEITKNKTKAHKPRILLQEQTQNRCRIIEGSEFYMWKRLFTFVLITTLNTMAAFTRGRPNIWSAKYLTTKVFRSQGAT